jgi:ABC-type Fe2+-enterobactin transport system substrate-binding protein
MAAISRWKPTMQSHYAKLLRTTLTASLMLVAIAGPAVAAAATSKVE